MLLELALAGLVIGTVLLVALLRDVVAAVVAFAVFSFGLALIWTLLAAPDVALAEAAVGAGVMSVLLLLTVARTSDGLFRGRQRDSKSSESEGIEDGDRRFEPVNGPLLLLLSLLAVPLVWTVNALPELGSWDAPAVSPVSPDGTLSPYGEYVQQVVVEPGFSNAVAAVLVVYRNLDTFGELVVAFTAVVAVLVVLGRDDVR